MDVGRLDVFNFEELNFVTNVHVGEHENDAG